MKRYRLTIQDFYTKSCYCNETDDQVIHKSRLKKKDYSGLLDKRRRVDDNYYQELHQFAWKQKQKATVINGKRYLDYPCFNYCCNAMIAELQVIKTCLRLKFDSLDDDIMFDAEFYFKEVSEIIEIKQLVMTFIEKNYRCLHFQQKLYNYLKSLNFLI